MGKRLLGKRLRRQAQKGKVRPRTLRRAMDTMRIDPTPPPAPPAPVRTLTANRGGKVELFQDQLVRKFHGGKIKTKQK
tara:strand:- start:503 stop:736 length:234 start_codon:yes stop_codon:yes gene_type:complete